MKILKAAEGFVEGLLKVEIWTEGDQSYLEEIDNNQGSEKQVTWGSVETKTGLRPDTPPNLLSSHPMTFGRDVHSQKLDQAKNLI